MATASYGAAPELPSPPRPPASGHVPEEAERDVHVQRAMALRRGGRAARGAWSRPASKDKDPDLASNASVPGGLGNTLPPAAQAGGAGRRHQRDGRPAEEMKKAGDVSPMETAIQAYRAGRFDEATRGFDALAPGDPNAELWAARAIREGKGCGNALARFDKVAQRARGTPPGWDALLEGPSATALRATTTTRACC